MIECAIIVSCYIWGHQTCVSIFFDCSKMACFFYSIGDTGGRDNMLQKTNIFDQIKSRKIVDSIMLPPPQKLVITKSMYN